MATAMRRRRSQACWPESGDVNIRVQLTRKGWAKATKGEVAAWVRGQAHLGDVHCDAGTLAEKFAEVASKDDVAGLDRLVSTLNGNWATVVECGSWAYLAADHLRSIQVLYRVEDGVFHVFDDMADFRKAHRLEFAEDCVHEYLSSGYVYGSRTLFKDTFSLQAAERVWAGDGSLVEHAERADGEFSPAASRRVCRKCGAVTIEAWRYWRYVPNIDKPVAVDDALARRIDETFLTAMRRLVESVGDRRIVVPLSGGYDSRLIVNYLHRLGVKDVLCYTYGVKGNGESRCSKEVASRLGYEWHYVEYTSENQTALLEDAGTDACFRYMCNGTNRYCNQEHTALLDLKDAGVVSPERDVVVPGYYFDVLAGSKIKPSTHDWNAASNSLADENNFFLKNAYGKTARAIKDIFLQNGDIGGKAFFETFLWQERLAKFIVNNVRDFEWLGFDWRLPLCDRDLFDLWLSLPYSERYERRYFRRVFPRVVADELRDVEFNVDAKVSFLRKARHWVGERVPYAVRFFLERMFGRTVKNAGSLLADARVDVPCLASRVLEGFPFLRHRLADLSGTSSNAAIALRGLLAEMAVC